MSGARAGTIWGIVELQCTGKWQSSYLEMCPAFANVSLEHAESFRLTRHTVKYSAFLRKQTRYNPTRGGMSHSSISDNCCHAHEHR